MSRLSLLVVPVLLAATAVVAASSATAAVTVAAPPANVTTLNGIVDALNRHGGPSGTAWGVDEQAGQVVLYVSAEAPAQSLLRYAAGFGRSVRVVHVPSSPDETSPAASSQALAASGPSVMATTVRAGDRIYGSGGLGGAVTCTAGFAVMTSNPLPPPPYAANRFLISGQCASGYHSWYLNGSGGVYIGSTAAANFPRTDYGVIAKAAGINALSEVNLRNGTYRRITSSGDAYKNRPVCLVGAGSGLRCGTITATNLTVNYGQDPYVFNVYGLAAANICTTGIDRGGPVFDGNTAVGLISGRLGSSCLLSITYIQPVRPAMQAHSLFFPPQ